MDSVQQEDDAHSTDNSSKVKVRRFVVVLCVVLSSWLAKKSLRAQSRAQKWLVGKREKQALSENDREQAADGYSYYLYDYMAAGCMQTSLSSFSVKKPPKRERERNLPREKKVLVFCCFF